MTEAEIEAAVLKALASVAPEAETASIQKHVPFRDQIDLDSFDFLNFMIALHSEVGVDVPEADYAKLATLEAAVGYLAGRRGRS